MTTSDTFAQQLTAALLERATEDGLPTVPPRDTASIRGARLRFPGGAVDPSSFPPAHPDSVTPTTTARSLMLDELADADRYRESARKLIEQGRIDEARFELRMAARHINNALQWSEP